MVKLTITEHISLDGVIQHSADENGFPYGEWTPPYRTPEGRAAVMAVYGESFDLLLGRKTYDLWSGYWPTAPGSPLSDRLCAAVKHVVTHRPESLAWGPAKALGPDLAEEVRRLKVEADRDLVLAGSSTLTSTLLEHGLADEVVLMVYPVLLGTGKRLFAEKTPARALKLVRSVALPSGIVVSHYTPAGPLPTA